VDRDRLDYEVTIEDPNVLTKPYTQRITLMLREGTRLREYSCAENNLDPAVLEKLMANPTLFLRPGAR
jgi:arsenate reductase-like glutaredoxin family protein